MTWHIQRKVLGDPFIFGDGIEIGAGIHPVFHAGITNLVFFDKCDTTEFIKKFGTPSPYQILSAGQISEKYPNGADFISCHHVIEHLADPISQIMSWLSLLKKTDGVFYFSIPSEGAEYEIDRLQTPLDHILEDYFFERSEDSYSSKQHIYSFALNWSEDGSPGKPWFANNSISDFSKTLLREVKDRNEHDLHWHTYSLEVMREIVEISFYLLGVDYEVLLEKELSDHKSCYFAFRTKGVRKICETPQGLKNFKKKIIAALSKLDHLSR